jgi:ribosomal-protein-alanine N-acetyltransferase
MYLGNVTFLGEKDIEAIVRVETACFSSPWPRSIFVMDLGNSPSRRLLGEPKGAVYVGVFSRETLWGYGACRWEKQVLSVMRLAVLPEARRCGFASQLLLAMCVLGEEAKCRRVRLEVRESNDGARAFYRLWGFFATDRQKGYYAESGEDALVLEAALPLVFSDEEDASLP